MLQSFVLHKKQLNSFAPSQTKMLKITYALLVGMAFLFGALTAFVPTPTRPPQIVVAATEAAPSATVQPTAIKVNALATTEAKLSATAQPTAFLGLQTKGTPEVFVVRLSYYWPPLGGTNCHPNNWVPNADGARSPDGYLGRCVSLLMGENWRTWDRIGAACPPSIPLRSRIWIDGLQKSFYCVDRGGAVEDLPDGTRFIDILQDFAPWYPKASKIKDKYCPSTCFTSPAWLLE